MSAQVDQGVENKGFGFDPKQKSHTLVVQTLACRKWSCSTTLRGEAGSALERSREKRVL
jgi:hypothetical protein